MRRTVGAGRSASSAVRHRLTKYGYVARRRLSGADAAFLRWAHVRGVRGGGPGTDHRRRHRCGRRVPAPPPQCQVERRASGRGAPSRRGAWTLPTTASCCARATTSSGSTSPSTPSARWTVSCAGGATSLPGACSRSTARTAYASRGRCCASGATTSSTSRPAATWSPQRAARLHEARHRHGAGAEPAAAVAPRRPGARPRPTRSRRRCPGATCRSTATTVSRGGRPALRGAGRRGLLLRHRPSRAAQGPAALRLAAARLRPGRAGARRARALPPPAAAPPRARDARRAPGGGPAAAAVPPQAAPRPRMFRGDGLSAARRSTTCTAS